MFEGSKTSLSRVKHGSAEGKGGGLEAGQGELVGFAEMKAMQEASAATISNPIAPAAVATLTMGGKGASGGLKVEGRGGIEPGEPGRAADGGAGEGIVGVQSGTHDFGSGSVFTSRHR